MVTDKEFEKLKKEHNKVARWIEFFSHRMDEIENKIEELKRENDKTREKEQILGRNVLKLIKEKK